MVFINGHCAINHACVAYLVPIVIRLTGTNEEIALKILQENGFSAMTDMDEAVKKAVSLATGKAA